MHTEHSRFEIWNQAQHPFKHTLEDFAYTNPAVPGVTTLQSTLDYIFAVLYPQTMPAVNTPGDLPLVGNTINDFRVVYDDGDGNAAAYRWEKREDEVSPSWHKIYDMDWGADSVLASFLTVTQDLYVWRDGRSQLDPAGNPIVGTYAGQTIYGGKLTGENLTLNANFTDNTGYVQTDNHFRPTADGTIDLGTSSEQWRDVYIANSAVIGTLTLSPGVIEDSGGLLDFISTDLTTNGDITANVFSGSSVVLGNLTISDGSIVDTDGAIDFANNALTTTGDITANAVNAGTLTIAAGSITDSSGSISFDNENLVTTGTLGAGNTTVTRLDSDNLRIDGNTISVLNSNGNLILQANGTGIIDAQSALTTLGITTTGTSTVTGQLNVDNLRIDGNVISSTNLNGNIDLTPNGTGHVTTPDLVPSADNTPDIGAVATRYKNLYLAGSIGDGSTSVTQTTLQSLRDINVGVTAGMSLFWDGSKWVASAPDTEITHGSLSGLTTGDAGHTQFVMLAGRTSGQTIQGGTGAGELLVLESTSDVSKGTVQVKDHFRPFTNASFSGSWSGTDLGGSSNYFRDLYTKGELKNGRIENFTFGTLPANSSQNIGRMSWTTDRSRMYVDTGTTWAAVSYGKFLSDVSFDGVVTTKDVDVSASIVDARQAIWQLRDNANDYEIIYTVIRATSASNVRIVTNAALPAGSYRLIGIE